MKTMFKIQYYFSVIFLISFISCSKTNKTTPAPVIPPVKNCKIIAASLVSGTVDTVGKYTFTYDSAGRLSGSLYRSTYSDTVSYSYIGNRIFRSVAAGANSSVDTITLNSAGLMVQDKEVVGNSVYMTNYVYDANGELSTYTQQQNSYPPVSSSYTFNNGDNTLISSTSGSDTLTYDSSKPSVNGNLDQFNQLLYLGAYYVINKHLLISESHGTSTTYTYQFDSNANISSLKMTTGANSVTINYTYSCQ